ncbi:MAG: hypothetical protein AAGC58_07580 [Asticcacaulis sp.]
MKPYTVSLLFSGCVALAPFAALAQSASPRPTLKTAPKAVVTADAKKLEQYKARQLEPVSRLEARAPQRLMHPRRQENAAQQKARVAAANAKTKTIATITVPFTITGPHIARIDGLDNGRYEPGGQYQIRGKGFGTRKGTVFLKENALGKSIALNILHWSDERIYAEIPADLSGVPDVPKVTLVVGPVGANALENRTNGFYAAREEHRLTVFPAGVLGYPKGRFADTVTNTANGATIRRYVEQGANDACFQPGTDRIDTTRLNLKPGFWVHSFDVWYPKLESYVNTDVGEIRYTGFGQYSHRWDGDNIMIDWGVQRRRSAPWTLYPGASQCESIYRVTLNINGPRGIPLR